jgi:2-methylisocitrate lyase-like PEP mutase family enzyme
MMNPGKRLRELIAAPDILVMPGIFDGYSARLVQRSGFHAGFLTGGGISESRLGQLDIGLMGLEENLQTCRAMVACCDLPMIADGDTGYGNAVNVHHTVRAFEQAGVGGLMLEDQVWPKRCGHMKGKDVISAEENAEKIRSAAQARRNPDFVIKSRTDAYGTHGLAEAIRRLNLYAEAGADLLFADAVLAEQDIATLVKETIKPVSVNMGFGIRTRSTTPLISAKRLEDLGVSAVIYPRLLTAAAVQGMIYGMQALKASLGKDEIVNRPDLAVSFEELNELCGYAESQELEQRYLTKAALDKKYQR